MQRGFKTKVILNNQERAIFVYCCDVARFVYNWALADRRDAYEQSGESVTYNAQKVRFNAIKREMFPWIINTPYGITPSAGVGVL